MYRSLGLCWYDSKSVNSHIHFLLLSPAARWMRPLRQSSLLMAALWRRSSREIDFSRWSDIAWCSMWHLCEQAWQLIILALIQSCLYIIRKRWMNEKVRQFLVVIACRFEAWASGDKPLNLWWNSASDDCTYLFSSYRTDYYSNASKKAPFTRLTVNWASLRLTRWWVVVL